MRVTEKEILGLIFQSSHYQIFEVAFIVSLLSFFLLLFSLAWREFLLLLSLVRLLAVRDLEELPALSSLEEGNVSLKEVA